MTTHREGLEIILGPMFSGKTTELVRRLQVAKEVGLAVLYVNNSIDTRGEKYSTHNKQMDSDLKIESVSTRDLSKVNFEKYDVIGIDEAQFFPSLELLKEWSDKRRIVVAGLDGDSERRTFGKILDLVPFADSVSKQAAKCKECAKQKKITDAIFTFKFGPKTKEKVDVGAADKYEAVCRECYVRLKTI